jgi:hypothetical protein
MHKQIFKYPLQLGFNDIGMPSDCDPLCAQMQNGQLVIWVECEPGEPLIPYGVLVVGTGQVFDREIYGNDLCYLSTVQDGEFVWHVYA